MFVGRKMESIKEWTDQRRAARSASGRPGPAEAFRTGELIDDLKKAVATTGKTLATSSRRAGFRKHSPWGRYPRSQEYQPDPALLFQGPQTYVKLRISNYVLPKIADRQHVPP